MENTFPDRIQRAVLAKLGTALERIQGDLEDIGAAATFDVRSAEPAIRGYWTDYLRSRPTSESVRDDRVLVWLGTDEATSPAPLARSLTLFTLRRLLARQIEILRNLEKGEDEKLVAWCEQYTGVVAGGFDVDSLTFERPLPLPSEVVGYLRLARELLDADESASRKAAQAVGDSPTIAFARDFASAKLSSPAMGDLLRDLWNAEAPQVIDDVLASREANASGWAKLLSFYGDILKQLLRLDGTRRAEVLGDS